MNQLGRVAVFFLTLASLCPAVLGQEPGDVFREYGWKRGPWQRVVGPDATMSGAKALLPNPVNSLTISDLKDSIRAEIQIEKMTSHAGTANPRIRVNGHSWMSIPEPANVPGNRGSHTTTSMYLTMFYPKVSVPLSYLKEGTNKFELTCQAKGATGFGKLWPQFIIYAVTFRIYYKDSKPHATGEIVSPRSGGVLSDNPTFKAVVNGSVRQVDFVGDYHDFNWRGDGTVNGWQNGYRYSEIIDHMGSKTSSPWNVTWDNSWIPTQSKPFRVVARIEDKNGMVYITRPVTGLSMARKLTVVRYLNIDIDREWLSNYWNPHKDAFTNISEDISKAKDVKLFMRVWNGEDDGDIGLNNVKYHRRPGKDYELTWHQLPLPVSALRQGTNQIFTKGSKPEHGMETLWPSPELFVRYNIPEARGEFVAYGENCTSSRAKPVLGIIGRPKLGSAYTMQLTGANPNAPTFLLWGDSNEFEQGTALPLDLTFVGAPGCMLWTSIIRSSMNITDSQGACSFRIFVPNTPLLNGLHYFNQILLVEYRANKVGVLVSNGARILLGK